MGSAGRTRQSDGEGSSHLLRGSGGRHQVPREHPKIRRETLKTVLPVYGPLVSYVPNVDNSDRTNPANQWPVRSATTTVV